MSKKAQVSKHIPEEIVTLSSGAVVVIKSPPPRIVRSAVMMANIPAIQRIRDGEQEEGDNRQAAEAIDGYYDELILWMCTLADDLPDDDHWVRVLKRSKSLNIDWSMYDLKNPEDKRELYLKYHAFQSPEDFDELTSRLNIGDETEPEQLDDPDNPSKGK